MRIWALVAVAVTAMAAGAALYLSRSRPVPTPVPPAATQATPPVAAPVELLPQFQLADRTGQLRSLADWQGKALIVNFWATWCAPCRREIPLLRQLARDHAAEGFQVIGIAVDFRDKVLAYADEMQIDYPLLIGEQEALDAAAAFGVEAVGLPFTVFSDRQGRIVTSHLGELTAAEADIILGAVREVDAGRLTPAAARGDIKAALAALPDPPDAAD
jgi:thiol-disulfide isomerase/thioredoxin